MTYTTAALRGTCTAQSTIDSPLGPMLIARTERGLAGAWFLGQKDHPGELGVPEQPADALLCTVAAQLAAYFDAPRVLFDVPLDLLGTPFQREVWHALLAIPCGETVSYGHIAGAIGRPHAVRAVGAAIGRNPVAIIVPCHRVVGSNGALTGYAGGIDRKRALLALEGRQAQLPIDARTLLAVA
jgi:methylated-DNA-[protein]-cysteine S-methyltransferase